MPAPPNLQERIDGLRRVVRELPDVAARELDVLTAQSHSEQRAPDGSRFPAVQPYDHNRTGRFDPHNHIRYIAVVKGEEVVLEASHHAAQYQRYGTQVIPPRSLVPTGHTAGMGGENLGWWLPLLLGTFRAAIEKGVG